MEKFLTSADVVAICMALREEARQWAPGTPENTQLFSVLEKFDKTNLLRIDEYTWKGTKA